MWLIFFACLLSDDVIQLTMPDGDLSDYLVRNLAEKCARVWKARIVGNRIKGHGFDLPFSDLCDKLRVAIESAANEK